ncbi:MAG: chromosomal replication initiator protein DnaA [Flavobacteriales bacterium]|nr:MAG: chromosomal replication initiator protein DnaA [Flavobacteriales bacterium]
MTIDKKPHETAWQDCLKIIKDNVSPQAYKTWFEPNKAVRLVNKVLTIQVPSQFFYEWLEEHYVQLLHKTLKKVIGPTAKLEYNIIVETSAPGHDTTPYTINLPTGSNSTKSVQNEMGIPVNLDIPIKNPFIIPGLKRINIDSQLNPRYVFDNFVDGDCNKLARNAGLAIAQKPGGTAFNPLLIFGGCGLGKTHLAHAIGNLIKQNHKQKVVVFVSTEKFINQFIDSAKQGNNNQFVNFYQYLDVLIVDDVHFFAKKERTQEIFFQIFNHLHQNGKQIILTCDRPPKDLKNMDERLLSRFKWGLSADLNIPDFDTRVSILENKMYQDGITLNKDVVEYLAHNIDANVRELEGALISLLAQSSLTRKQLDLNLAKQIVKNFVKNSNREISIEYIQKLVCDYYNIPVEAVKSKTRKREIVQARQIAMYFTKDLTKSSLKNIGIFFGGRDHSTVIHACQTVNDLIETDKKFRHDVEEIDKRIKINTF